LVVGSIPTAGANLLINNDNDPLKSKKWHFFWVNGTLPFVPLLQFLNVIAGDWFRIIKMAAPE